MRAHLVMFMRGRRQAESLARARQMASAADFGWVGWLTAAESESVTPLLYASLREATWVPVEVRERLREAYFRNGARNALLMAELAAVLEGLTGRGVAVVVLKGAALAETVYGDVALRPMVDLDLLVQAQQTELALATMTDAGYVRSRPEVRRGGSLTYENEVLLHKQGPLDMALEVHWHLVDSPYFQRTVDIAWFWEMTEPAAFGGRTALVLRPEAQVLHLCAHLALHHKGHGLLWQYDLAEVLYCYEDHLDWDMILARGQAFALVLALRVALQGVVKDWGAPMPAPVWERLRALPVSAAEATAFQRLTAEHRPMAQRFWTDLEGQADWRSRLGYAMMQLFPTQEYMAARYQPRHPVLLPLSYPYRWLLGVRDLVRMVGGGEGGGNRRER